jgi:hypothetical protein
MALPVDIEAELIAIALIISVMFTISKVSISSLLYDNWFVIHFEVEIVCWNAKQQSSII